MTHLEQRIFELAKNLQLINFATITEDGKPRVRYVVGYADPTLTLRFSTHLHSNKVRQIAGNPNVFLTLGANSVHSQSWLQVEGIAAVSTDAHERQAFWFDALKHHFQGVDDPSYCIVIVKPISIQLGSTGASMEEWQRHTDNTPTHRSC